MARSRHLHRRPRPGRGAGAGARQGAAARREAREHLHRGFARGIRPRLRLPDVPRQRAIRGALSARHLDRAAAHRQAADRDRHARSAPTRSATAPPARATTRSASNSAYYALEPDIKVIAPWREWDLTSRTALLEYAEKHQIPIAKDKRGEAPFSTDANLLHTSSEGKVLEDPARDAGLRLFAHRRTPRTRRTQPQYVTIDFDKRRRRRGGWRDAVAGGLLARLNELGRDAWHRPARSGREPLRRHEVARHVRNAGRHDPAHRPSRRSRAITLDRGAAHLKDELMPRYAELIYNGFWFSPEREMLQAAIDQEPGIRHRPRAAEALQGQRCPSSAARAPIRSTIRNSSPSRRARRLRPARRRRLHQAQRAAAAHAGEAQTVGAERQVDSAALDKVRVAKAARGPTVDLARAGEGPRFENWLAWRGFPPLPPRSARSSNP